MQQGGWSGSTQATLSELLSVFVKQMESLLGSQPFLKTLKEKGRPIGPQAALAVPGHVTSHRL